MTTFISGWHWCCRSYAGINSYHIALQTGYLHTSCSNHCPAAIMDTHCVSCVFKPQRLWRAKLVLKLPAIGTAQVNMPSQWCSGELQHTPSTQTMSATASHCYSTDTTNQNNSVAGQNINSSQEASSIPHSSPVTETQNIDSKRSAQ